MAGLTIAPLAWLLFVWLERGGRKTGKAAQVLGVAALAIGVIAASAFWLRYMV